MKSWIIFEYNYWDKPGFGRGLGCGSGDYHGNYNELEYSTWGNGCGFTNGEAYSFGSADGSGLYDGSGYSIELP